ncbi:MAG: sigma-70 family RNA polymerase sigma factor [Bacteroidia bacterium]
MIGRRTYTEKDIVAGLRQSDPRIVGFLYKNHLPAVVGYLKRYSCNEEEVRDLFQEAMMVLFQRIRSGNFSEVASVKTFLISVCRNLWFKKSRKLKEEQLNDDQEFLDPDKDTLEAIFQIAEYRLYFHYFNSLSEQCKGVLEKYFRKVPMQEIADHFNTTLSYIRKKKFTCKEQLIQSIRHDPSFKELIIND